MKIKQVGVLSMGVNLGIYLALFGLLAGLMVALMSLTGMGSQAGGMMAGFGMLAVVVIPVIYAIVGFIGGLISATLLTLFVLPALYAWFGRVPVNEGAETERSREPQLSRG